MLDKLAGTGKTKLATDAAWKSGRGGGLSFSQDRKKMTFIEEGASGAQSGRPPRTTFQHFLVMFLEGDALTKHCMVTQRHGLAVHICHICVIFLGIAYGKEPSHPAKLRKPT